MTLKHIDFYDSPVMVQLVRNAIADGTVKPTEPADLTKEASESVSEDLVESLVSLAGELRQRGYRTEAASLEEKILQYKVATEQYKLATEYSSVLDQAHPDGDVEMAPAHDELGEVETLESEHRKIMEIAQKQPKAAAAQAVLDAVGAIFLGGRKSPDLDKTAQEAAQFGDPTTGPKNVEDYFSDSRIAREKTANEINSLISSVIPPVADMLQSHVDNVYNAANLNNPIFYKGCLEGNKVVADVYGHYAGVPGSEVLDFYRRYAIAYGGPAKTDEAYLFAKINQKDSSAVAAFVKEVTPNVNIYQYIPAPPTEEQLTTWQKTKELILDVAKFVTPIGWVYMGGKWLYDLEKDTQATQKIFQAVKNSLEADATRLVSSSVRENGSVTMKKEFDAALAPVVEAETNLKSIKLLDPKNAVSNKPILDQLSAVQDSLQNFISKDLKKIQSALSVLGTESEFVSSINQTIHNISEIKNNVASMPIDKKNDVVASAEEVTTIADVLLKTAQRLMQYIGSKFKEGTPDYDRWKTQAQQFFTAAQIILKHKDKQWMELGAALKPFFPVDSYADLKDAVNDYSQQVSKLAAGKFSIEKEAQLQRNKSPENAKSPTTAPTTAVTTSHAVSPEEKDAVQTMQFTLMQLAGYVQKQPEKFPKSGQNAVAVLLQVGPGKQKVDMDGKWGVNTAKALAKAQELLSEWNAGQSNKVSGTISKGPMMGQGASAITAAKQNVDTIMSLMGVVYGVAVGNSSVYDHIPVNASFSQAELMAVNPDYPALTSQHMSSMAALYNHLVNDLKIQPEQQQGKDLTDMGTRGFTVQKWDEILKWMMMRAKNQDQQAGADRKLRETARNYHASAVALWNQMAALWKQTAASNKEKGIIGTIISEDDLPGQKDSELGNQFGRGAKALKGPAGAAYPQGNGRGGNQEGEDINMPAAMNSDVPPISMKNGTINLRSAWFNGLISDEIRQAHPFINKSMFETADINTLARTYFNGQPNQSQAIQQAIQAMGIPMQQGQDGNWYGIEGRQLVPLAQLMQRPVFQKHYQAALMIQPRNSIVAFLSTLSQGLNQAVASYMQQNGDNETVVTHQDAWHQQWQRTIQYKFQQLRTGA